MKMDMVKTLAIVGLLLVVAGETSYILVKSKRSVEPGMVAQAAAPTRMPARPPAPLAKGDIFAGSAVSKFAYLIFPGELSPEAQIALAGFKIVNKKLFDGSTQVALTPKDADDESQQYILKPGETLYFIEMTPVDDKDNLDKNLRDDYGVIVDANGLVK